MDIRGKWFNELKSQMVIEVHGCTVTGKYHTGVGEAEGEYDLIGRVNMLDQGNGTIAFAVAWRNGMKDTDAVTAWSGEIQEIDGIQCMITTWLMTKQTLQENDWRATIVGRDYFTRSREQAVDFSKPSLFRQPSHPFPPAML
jgi:Avidin family